MNDDLTSSDASDPTTGDDATNASADGDASGAGEASTAGDVSASGGVSADVDAVSAVVDGVATPAEQAVVESSPELRRLVATMTSNRAHLTSVSVPTESRECAVTAALAAFDARTPTVVAEGAETNPATAPNVVRLERRRRQYRLAMGAAAAVAVLFVGAAATGWLGRGDDSSTAAQRKSEAPALDLQAAEGTVAGGDAAAAAPAATDAASSEAASADAPAEDVIEASVLESFDASDQRKPSDATDAPAAANPPAPVATIGSIDDGAGVDVDRIDSPAALAVYALDRPRLIASDDGISCIIDDAADVELLGTIIYDGIDAVVVRNSTSGVVSARDLATCSVIVSVTP